MTDRQDIQAAGKWPIAWVACLLVITVGLPLWHYYGMNRDLRIDGSTSYTVVSFDDRGVGGTSVATVKRVDDALVLNCHLNTEYKWPYCGFGVILGEGTHGVDLSAFKTVSFDIRTTGPHVMPIRIYLRNFNPIYSSKSDSTSLKINQVQFIPSQEKHPLVLSLRNFQVPPWWLTEKDLSPEHAAPDLRNVDGIEINTGSIAKAGNYKIRVLSIVFHGKWLSLVQVLSIVLVLWLLTGAAYLLNAFYQSRRTVRVIRNQKDKLEEINSALKLEREELETLATHDELTGLYNRVGLRNRLYDLASSYTSNKNDISAVFIDIDHFKNINDQHGHIIGDELLCSVADFLKASTRTNDFLCRWGGEEFILFCDDTTLESASETAEKLRVLISERAWPHGVRLTCSFGVAQMKPGEGMAQFLRRADDALYRAKNNGRNRVIRETIH